MKIEASLWLLWLLGSVATTRTTTTFDDLPLPDMLPHMDLDVTTLANLRSVSHAAKSSIAHFSPILDGSTHIARIQHTCGIRASYLIRCLLTPHELVECSVRDLSPGCLHSLSQLCHHYPNDARFPISVSTSTSQSLQSSLADFIQHCPVDIKMFGAGKKMFQNVLTIATNLVALRMVGYVDEESLAFLASIIHKLTTLRKLTIQSPMKFPNSLRVLVEALPQSHLEELALRLVPIPLILAEQLAVSLKCMKMLKSLTLTANSMNDSSILPIFNTLPFVKNLEELHIELMDIEDVSPLAKSLPHTRIRKLSIKAAQPTADSFITFASALPSTHLNDLSLTHIRVSSEAWNKMIDILPKTRISSLCLSHARLESSFGRFFETLPHTRITSLDISMTMLPRHQIDSLIDLIQTVPWKSLDMTGIHPTAHQAISILSHVAKSNMESLGIGYLQLSQRDMESVLNLIPLTKLKVVRLDQNGIDGSMLETLVQMVRQSQLEKLALRVNRMTEETLAKFLSGVKGSKLKVLDLRENPVSPLNARIINIK